MYTTPEPQKSWKWAIILAVVLLLHIGVLSLKTQWETVAPPPKINVQTIDPDTLEKLKQRWRQKKMVLDNDEKAPSEKVPPKDARFFSARNQTVEREQQARNRGLEIPGARKKSVLSRLALPLIHDTSGTQSQQQSMPSQAQEMLQHQDVLEKNIPEGAENLLNTQEAVYYSFYARMYRTMAPIFRYNTSNIRWAETVRPGEYTAIVEAVLDKDGNILQLNWRESSGLKEFDEAVEATWRKAGQFHNPPKQLIGADGTVRVPFSFQLNTGRR
jgi:TonB family protein